MKKLIAYLLVPVALLLSSMSMAEDFTVASQGPFSSAFGNYNGNAINQRQTFTPSKPLANFSFGIASLSWNNNPSLAAKYHGQERYGNFRIVLDDGTVLTNAKPRVIQRANVNGNQIYESSSEYTQAEHNFVTRGNDVNSIGEPKNDNNWDQLYVAQENGIYYVRDRSANRNGGQAAGILRFDDIGDRRVVEFSMVNMTRDTKDRDGGFAGWSLLGDATAAAPDAVDDSAIVTNDADANIDVLANDSVPAGVQLLEIISQPSSGNASIVMVNDEPQVKYSPESGFIGNTQLTYRVTDNNGNTDTATLNLDVQKGAVIAPKAANDQASTTNDQTSININVLANDTVPEGVQSLEVSQQPANGSAEVVAINGQPQIRYILEPDYTGTVNFAYQLTDNEGNTAGANVSVQVRSSNFCEQGLVNGALCALGCLLFPTLFCPDNAPVNIDATDIEKTVDGDVLDINVKGTVTEGATVTAQPVDSNGNPVGNSVDCTVLGTSFECNLLGGIGDDIDRIITTGTKGNRSDEDSIAVPAAPEIAITDVGTPDNGITKVTGTVTEGSTVTAQPTDDSGTSTGGSVDCTVQGTTFSCSVPTDDDDDKIEVTATKDGDTGTDNADIPALGSLSLTVDEQSRTRDPNDANGTNDLAVITGTVTEGSTVTAQPSNNGSTIDSNVPPLDCTVTGNQYTCTGDMTEDDNFVFVTATKPGNNDKQVVTPLACTAAVGCGSTGGFDPDAIPPSFTVNIVELETTGAIVVTGSVDATSDLTVTPENSTSGAKGTPLTCNMPNPSVVSNGETRFVCTGGDGSFTSAYNRLEIKVFDPDTGLTTKDYSRPEDFQ